MKDLSNTYLILKSIFLFKTLVLLLLYWKQHNFVAKLMSGISLYGGKRIIILDESDRLTENAQTSLRRPLEEFEHLCSVIFTYNYNNTIIQPLKSRCFEFDFNIKQDEKDEFYKCLKRRLRTIIKKEDINISTKELKKIIKKEEEEMERLNERT